MKRLAAALLAVLALSAVFTLSACAVTGQPARPGTAATYDGTTITTAQVAGWGNALNDMGFTAQNDEGAGYDPGAVLTLLLLRPAIEKEAAKEGVVFGDDEILSEATKWMTAQGVDQMAPTQDMTDLVRTVHSLYALLTSSDAGAEKSLTAALDSIEANAVVNPMYGSFTKAFFMQNLSTLAKSQQTAVPEGVSYLVLKDATGFAVNVQRDWMVDEGLPSANPSPSPSASRVTPSPGS